MPHVYPGGVRAGILLIGALHLMVCLNPCHVNSVAVLPMAGKVEISNQFFSVNKCYVHQHFSSSSDVTKSRSCTYISSE